METQNKDMETQQIQNSINDHQSNPRIEPTNLKQMLGNTLNPRATKELIDCEDDYSDIVDYTDRVKGTITPEKLYGL